MKKFLFSTAATLALITAPLFAGPFGLPDHEKNGYRDTGCDAAQQVQIVNDKGKYLYSNNPSCNFSPRGQGSKWPKPEEEDEEDN